MCWGLDLIDFDAKQWLDSLSQAVSLIRTEELLNQARRERMLSLGGASSDPHVSSSPSNDPMRAVDIVVDAESDMRKRLESAIREVEYAKKVFLAMREKPGSVIADSSVVLELMYVYGESLADISKTLNISVSTARRRKDLGIDWLNANGLPNVVNGRTSNNIAAM